MNIFKLSKANSLQLILLVKFEVTLKIQVFWDVLLCLRASGIWQHGTTFRKIGIFCITIIITAAAAQAVW